MIAPAELNRLAAVLGMLGSDAVGERAAAALHATRILKASGTTWRELLGVDTRTTPETARWTMDGLAACRQHPGLLTEWERSFVASVSSRRKPMTERQAATLAKIAAELVRRRRA